MTRDEEVERLRKYGAVDFAPVRNEGVRLMERFPPAMQRPALLRLADKLEISLLQLRRDECGDWMLRGRFGHVYSLACSYQILISGWAEDDAPWTTARGWNQCKADMSFARLTQDGHQEGAFILDIDPSPEQAEKIRKWVGLKKRRQLDDETLTALRERGKTLSAFRTKQDASSYTPGATLAPRAP